MNNSTGIREQLTFKAWLQWFLILASVVFTFLYTLPKIEEINAQTEQTNAVIKKYESIESNGIPANELEKTISAVWNNNELLELVKKSPTETANVIKKTGSDPYLTWLSNSLNNSETDRKTLSDMKAKINSIIPTLSPISGNISEENITLREYISYIENTILKNFGITSLSPLGIDWVKYEEKDGKVVNPIGSFVVDLNFKTSNANLSKLLDFIKETGKPDILSDTGTLVTIPKVMSNPLITVDSLSLAQIIDPRFPNQENSGRIALKFYVRGSSAADSSFLLESFTKKKVELEQSIEKRIKECSANASTCMESENLQNFAKKEADFAKVFTATIDQKKWNPVETVYFLSQQFHTLESLKKELESIK